MFRLGTLGLIIACGVLVLTNPSQDAHRKVLYASAATEATHSDLLGKIAADVLEDVNLIPLGYNNYYVFSTTTVNGKTASIGVCSRVWKLKELK